MLNPNNFKVIPDCPMYEVNCIGDVRNTHRPSEYKNQSFSSRGDLKVSLYTEDGRRTSRLVKRLVAEAFVRNEQPEINDTPICMDNDKTNVSYENLAWRPRWFAWEYVRQFESNMSVLARGSSPVMNVTTKTFYPNLYEAAVAEGLLMYQLSERIINRHRVWPSGCIYEYVPDAR